ncbi:hypothetical protein [Rhizobium etli]|uniref:Uncharacterized protein n=1 Tax=Rhizobium etli TaxID=29449 RepID=A0A7W6ZN17_RHIET|nr:hypothetical protein [Rhizobium etli]MBB4483129.1 hypothetical protein [Rhizobium etli]MBB4538957.1 hypothetical protein [Rhizobium etli]
MLNRKHYRGTLTAGVAVALLQVGGAIATPSNRIFYDAALCNPPYSLTAASTVYDAAEELAKPETSSLDAAIYKVPQQIGQDGFQSNEVFFANSAVGILIEGLHADELAAKYDLKPETSDLLGTSSKGYSRQLSEERQPAPGLTGPGKVSIVAREGGGLPGKTLLACELVAD